MYVFILQFSSHSSLLCTVKCRLQSRFKQLVTVWITKFRFSLFLIVLWTDKYTSAIHQQLCFNKRTILPLQSHHFLHKRISLSLVSNKCPIRAQHTDFSCHTFQHLCLLILWYTLIIPIMHRDTSHKISSCKYVCPVFPPPSYNLNKTVQSYFMHDCFLPVTGLWMCGTKSKTKVMYCDSCHIRGRRSEVIRASLGSVLSAAICSTRMHLQR